ncbi:MAG: sulfite exporter TauE/SafE family protein [Clostridiales bacterium]|nr:sulfite exporter TauE/SafE family protein [Clostridiales bacterium]
MNALIAGLAGAICGVLSGLGIGGGTLLMVWMTAVMGIAQKSAQGINLLYFLPTAACALFFHMKNRLIRARIVIPAAIAGCIVATGAAVLATAMDTGLLRKLFGGFLVIVGLTELFGRQRDRKDK